MASMGYFNNLYVCFCYRCADVFRGKLDSGDLKFLTLSDDISLIYPVSLEETIKAKLLSSTQWLSQIT